MEAMDTTKALSTNLFSAWHQCLNDTCHVAEQASEAGRTVTMPNLQRYFLRRWSHACMIEEVYCDQQIRAGQISGKNWIRQTFRSKASSLSF